MCSRPHEKNMSDSRQKLAKAPVRASALVPPLASVTQFTSAPTPTSVDKPTNVSQPTSVSPTEPTDKLDYEALARELDMSDTETDNYVEAMEVLKPEEDLNDKSKQIDSGENNQTSSAVVMNGCEKEGVVDTHIQDLDIRQALEEHLSKIDVQPSQKASNKYVEWALVDANILKERLSVHYDALGTSLEDFNEKRFRDDPMTLLSWASNLEVFLEEAAAIRKRCLHLFNFRTHFDK